MHSRLDTVLLVFAAIAFGITGLNLLKLRQLHAGRPFTAAAKAAPALAQGALRLGSETAPVVIVEFSDFECPYCVSDEPVLRQLRAQYGERLAIAYRQLPLEKIHPNARVAAEAAACADDQRAFEGFHDAVFALQGKLTGVDWTRLAGSSGVHDTAAFRACLSERRHADRVDQDVKLAEQLGIASTPSFVIGRKIVRGTLTAVQMASLIDQENSSSWWNNLSKRALETFRGSPAS